jgi:DNA-binding transcriptional ArsR family regulator
MAKMTTITDIEIAKLMLDPKRNRILSIATKEPITVKQMAEKMDELPSRLYYHVKKLEEAGFLELVETKQQGNLIEKYYQSNSKMRDTYTLDDKMASENSAYLMQRFFSLVNAGLSLAQQGMETGNKENNVSINVAFRTLTEADWKESQDKINEVLSEKSEGQEESDLEDEQATVQSEDEPDADQKDEYVYVLLTYRQKDAERLASKQQENNL